MKKKFEFYSLKQCMIDYQIQDLINLKVPNDDMVAFNKKYCVVDRNMVIDFLEFYNLLYEYGIIGEKEKRTDIDYQECIVTNGKQKKDSNS